MPGRLLGGLAQDTSVPTERSRAQIEKELQRYGADEFASGWDQSRAVIAFKAQGRQIRFELPLPNRFDDAFTKTPTGRDRSEQASYTAGEQAQRQRWRALHLVIKAKLEAVETGITTFEDEFMPHIVMPNGQTLGELVRPRIAEAYDTGKVPELLPAVTAS